MRQRPLDEPEEHGPDFRRTLTNLVIRVKTITQAWNRELLPTIVAIERALFSLRTVSTSSDYTMQFPDEFVLVNATAGNVTITLGLQTQWRRVIVKRVDSSGFTVTVVGQDSRTIDTAPNITLAALASATIVTDGTNYWTV